MPPIAELDAVAQGVVALAGLVAIFSPVLARFGKLEIMQFGHPKVFFAFSEVAALVAFLSVFALRGSLPYLPGGWLWILLSLVVAAGALWLALGTQSSENLSPGVVVLGLFLYALANGLMIFGLTEIVSRWQVFYSLEGEVVSKDSPSKGTQVLLRGPERSFRTETRGDGEFGYLLYKPEADDVERIKAADGEWEFVTWDPADERSYFISLEIEE